MCCPNKNDPRNHTKSISRLPGKWCPANCFDNLTLPLQDCFFWIPISTLMRFKQALRQRLQRIRIQLSQSFAHRLVQEKRLRNLCIDPWIDGVRGRAPAESVRHVVLDVRDAAKTMFQHSFIPFWIPGLRARLKPHSLLERTNLSLRRKRIRQINRWTSL